MFTVLTLNTDKLENKMPSKCILFSIIDYRMIENSILQQYL